MNPALAYRTSPPVGDSIDLRRILALPRRTKPDLEGIRVGLTEALRRTPDARHVCTSRCIRALLPVQSWALYEVAQRRGLLGPIGVGHGKTGLDILAPMVLPDCRVAVLLIPPNLREQFARDFAAWGQHFRVPNLAKTGTHFHTDGRPVLHVVAYSELSTAKSSDLLERIRPDFIIADEAHRLKNVRGSGAGRVARYMAAHPDTRVAAWSGTLTSHGLEDFAHISAWALREGSPAPLDRDVAREWATAIDPGEMRADAGALGALCTGSETVRDGFRRRLRETPGVVATDESAVGASIVIRTLRPEVPRSIAEALREVRRLRQRPDGEELVEFTQVARCARELASGFFYRWRWPRGESPEVIAEWLDARAEWHRELREELDRPRVHLDSPLLLARAAIRWTDGYKFRGVEYAPRLAWCGVVPPEDRYEARFDPLTGEEVDGIIIPAPPVRMPAGTGPLPTWRSDTFARWRRVKDSAQPETEAVWVDDFLLQRATAWARENVGVIWYDHDAFGRALGKMSGLPVYGGGVEASEGIARETGKRSIIASVKAHGTGKNLQAFAANLVANVPSSGAAWEQLIGRTHRQGQDADEVTVDVFQHTAELVDALGNARDVARYIEETLGARQKLCYAAFE